MGLRRISCLLSSSVKRLMAVEGQDEATDSWETIATGPLSGVVNWDTGPGSYPNWDVWG